jgi:hypothetical protein
MPAPCVDVRGRRGAPDPARHKGYAELRRPGPVRVGRCNAAEFRDAGLAECVRIVKPVGPLPVTEADRSASFEDAERFIGRDYTPPRFLDGLNIATFRTWIAGHSIDLDDARDLASRIDLVDKDASRIAGLPILMISGRRPSEVTERPVADS